MPLQQGLQGNEEGTPGRAREEPAEGTEDEAVGVLLARTADLALEDAELVAEGENLGEQGVVGLLTLDGDIEQGPDRGQEEAREHGGGS